jgi:hypothetical protein
MVSLTKCVATVLLFAIASANVGAAACLLDCESASAPATVSTPSCHDMDSLDSASIEIAPTAVVCHRDHDGLTAELASRNDTAPFRAAEVADLGVTSTSSARTLISPSSFRFHLQLTVQAPVGAPLPLRL